MAVLKWDEIADRRFETGVDHGVLYVMNGSTYGNGVPWNGLTSVSESPEGAEPNDLWADNIKYATLYSAETFGGTIEAYTYPEEFAQCDGSYVPVKGVYFGQQDRKAFGFSYRTKTGDAAGNEGYKLHIIYNAKASPSEKSYETVNDSPDAITLSWEITTTPVGVTITGQNLNPVSTITIDSRQFTTTTNGSTRLNLLEQYLYGTNSTAPRLPSPETVYGIINGTINSVA